MNFRPTVDATVNYRNFGFIPSGSLRRDWRGKLLGHPNLLKRLQARDIMNALDLKSSHIVLDFGCGSGFMTVEIAKLARVTCGIDISSQVLKLAVPARLRHKLRFLQVDETRLPFHRESFDRILASEVLMMVPDPQCFLRQMNTLLSAQGRLVLCNGTGHPAIERAYAKRSLVLRVLNKVYPARMPASYESYTRILNESFQNRHRNFLGIDQLHEWLAAADFQVERTIHSPGGLAGSYFSWSQFLLFLHSGRTLSQQKFVANYLFFSFLRRFEGKRYRGGVICVARKA